ncbi:MAG: lipopolysaccharide biosynthesis protein, partial [Promethearchaeota archaeon]
IIGIYATLEMLTRFSNVFIFSSNSYCMSKGTEILHKNGYKQFIEFIQLVYKKVFIILIFGSTLIIIFGKKILLLIFRPEISDYYILLPLLIFKMIIEFMGNPLQIILNALNEPKPVFYAWLASTIGTLIIVYPLIKFLMIYGIVIGGIITNVIVLLVLLIIFRKIKKDVIYRLNFVIN